MPPPRRMPLNPYGMRTAGKDGGGSNQPLRNPMKMTTSPTRRSRRWRMESGKIGWILLWLIGVPVPVLLVLYFLRGCT